MKDRQTQSDDWIGEWIARQREQLEQNAKSSEPANQGGQANPADILRRWMDAGQTYFDGLKSQGTQGETSAAFSDPFNVGNALLGAWGNAGLFQSGVAQQTSDMLGRLPPIGLAREQMEAWRELAAAQAQCRQIENELRAVLLKVQFDALDLLSERVRQRGAADPIDSFRALYDLWVECGEQVYSKLAHSEAYSKLQADLGNATMRTRARMQTVIEHALKQFDLPTRSELNSLHRQVRELRAQLEQLTAKPSPASKTKRAAPSPKVTRAARSAQPKRKRPASKSKRTERSRHK
jgi:class III poly(R)-hydroxyalkanoic acid synthase PhaE subunit